MVRTYWLVPGFNEASGNLDLQPFARIDQVEACHPRAYVHPIVLRRRLPDSQRGLAQAARDLRPLALDARATLQVFEDVPRHADDLIEVVNRVEATEPLPVGEQAGRLGDREALGAELLKGDGVELDRAP